MSGSVARPFTSGRQLPFTPEWRPTPEEVTEMDEMLRQTVDRLLSLSAGMGEIKGQLDGVIKRQDQFETGMQTRLDKHERATDQLNAKMDLMMAANAEAHGRRDNAWTNWQVIVMGTPVVGAVVALIVWVIDHMRFAK